MGNNKLTNNSGRSNSSAGGSHLRYDHKETPKEKPLNPDKMGAHPPKQGK